MQVKVRGLVLAGHLRYPEDLAFGLHNTHRLGLIWALSRLQTPCLPDNSLTQSTSSYIPTVRTDRRDTRVLALNRATRRRLNVYIGGISTTLLSSRSLRLQHQPPPWRCLHQQMEYQKMHLQTQLSMKQI